MTIKFSIVALIMLIITGCGSVTNYEQGRDNPQRTTQTKMTYTKIEKWNKYQNDTYKYEISYPDNFELWPTGPENERDGRSIRIAYEGWSAAKPVMDVYIYPKVDYSLLLEKWGEIKEMSRSSSEIIINGVQGEKIEYRWRDTEEISVVGIYLEGIFFHFQANSGIKTFEETEWWSIIETFRFW